MGIMHILVCSPTWKVVISIFGYTLRTFRMRADLPQPLEPTKAMQYSDSSGVGGNSSVASLRGAVAGRFAAEEEAAVPPRLRVRWRATLIGPGGFARRLRAAIAGPEPGPVPVGAAAADPKGTCAPGVGRVAVTDGVAGRGGSGEVGRTGNPEEDTAGRRVLLVADWDVVDRLDRESTAVVEPPMADEPVVF